MNEEKTIIEINGVKLEIDLRNAKKIDSFKVGDTVKILIKEYDSFTPYLGIIVGFDAFESCPTIVVAYLKKGYDEVTIEFTYINSKNKEVEMCRINDWDMPYSKTSILDKFDRKIDLAEESLRVIKAKKEMFLKMFGKYFESRVITADRL